MLPVLCNKEQGNRSSHF